MITDLTDLFLVFTVGGVAGYALRSYLQPAPGLVASGQRVFEFVTPNVTLRLFKLGRLSDAQIEQLADWLDAGKPFRGCMLYGPDGIMSRGEWMQVREELIDRGMAVRLKNKKVDLTPTGIASFEKLCTRHKQARNKRDACKHASAPVGGLEPKIEGYGQ